MNCPKCNCALIIGSSRYVVENDTNEQPTELYIEQDMKCRNRNCENNGKVIETIRSKIDIG